MSTDERTIKVIEFSGKKSDWFVWESKFLARAKRKGYKGLLLGKVEIPKENEDINDDKEKIKIKQLNELAYEDLLLSIDGNKPSGRTAFSLVNCSKDN